MTGCFLWFSVDYKSHHYTLSHNILSFILTFIKKPVCKGHACILSIIFHHLSHVRSITVIKSGFMKKYNDLIHVLVV